MRPLDTDALTDAQWGDYLFMRKNPKGLHREQWLHASGCRRWFNAERDTVTYRFSQFYKPGEAANDAAPAAPAQSRTLRPMPEAWHERRPYCFRR